ncbi:unnamed protein product [Gordionus sp. m RMFG-2023]|uniref:small ribosomal subunit protein mS29-like n=1 Tax=Gordionus sp. m RMFG-2023 TaxID=3053472 RepID=UPI0030E22778
MRTDFLTKIPLCNTYKKIIGLRSNVNWIPKKHLFENSELSDDELNKSFRISLVNPNKHNIDHLNKIYRVPWSEYKALFNVGRSFRREIIGQVATFQEFALMIRKPSLEIIHYLQNTNIDTSLINRYIIYGPNGSGKSMMLCHLLHYVVKVEDWFLFHIPNCAAISAKYKEVVPSTSNPNKFDLPNESNFLLKHFYNQNEEKLKKFDIKTSQDYVWNKRETTVMNSPLLDLIKLGIERPLYATDIVGILFKELKLQACTLKFKIILIADVVNAFFGSSRIPDQNKRYIDCNDVALIYHIKKMLKNDWVGGAAICTIDDQYLNEKREKNHSFMPKYLLKSEGFEFFDPFMPVSLKNFNQSEMFNMIDYYIERKWLQHPSAETYDCKKEIFYLTGGNGLDFYNFSRTW